MLFGEIRVPQGRESFLNNLGKQWNNLPWFIIYLIIYLLILPILFTLQQVNSIAKEKRNDIAVVGEDNMQDTRKVNIYYHNCNYCVLMQMPPAS